MARTLPTLAASLAAFALLAGCAQDAVSNQTDNFSYGGQVSNLSDTKTYTWQNTQGKATVNWGGQSASGTFTLTLKDSTGKTVYTRSIGGANQGGVHESTASGKSGSWTVSLEFKGFTGQMGLNLMASGGAGGNYCPPNVPGC